MQRAASSVQDCIAREAPEAGEIHWATAVDLMSDMVVLEDRQGCIVRCNAATTRFFNLSNSEIVSKNIVSLFFPDKSDGLFKNPFRGGPSNVQLAGHDGWFTVINHPLSGSGSSCQWIHIIKEITTCLNLQTTVLQQKAVVEQMSEAIIIANSAGNIQYVNTRFEEMTGWTVEDVKGQNILVGSDQDLDQMLYRDAMQVLFSGKKWSGVFTAQRKDGSSFEQEMTVSPVLDSNGRLLNLVAVSQDITEKKQLESIAEASNMVENIGFVFSGIRHELGNPVNSIKTALSVLNANIDRWPRAHVVEYLNRMLTEVGRVEYLLKTLKSFNMHERPTMQSVDLIPFVENLLKLVGGDFAKRGIRFSMSLDTNLNKCKADPQALHQIFLNLFANAADAMKSQSDPTIFISINNMGKMIQIKIIDNGVGMDANQQDSVFKPFFTSKVSGTGLGLVIVKKLLAGMKGTIGLNSEIDVGTEVSILLEATNG